MSTNKFTSLIAETVEGNGSIEELIFKLIKLIVKEDAYNYRRKYLLEGVKSGHIVRFLSFLENENQTIRKLSLLLFSLIVANPRSKIYFLEKCGFGLSFGKVLFTRLKYLQNSLQKNPDSLNIVRSCLSVMLNSKPIDRSVIFWHVSIADIEQANVKIIDFYESQIDNKMEIHKLIEILPDPIESLCGFEFCEYDKIDLEFRESMVSTDRSKRDKIASTDEISSRNDKFNKKQLTLDKSADFGDPKSRRNEELSPMNRSTSRNNKSGPNDVLLKYKTSIKERTPSLNVKKDPKSSIVIESKRQEISPLRISKPSDPKVENKNIKSQKINELVSKNRTSKSPATEREFRPNVSERMSKIYTSRK